MLPFENQVADDAQQTGTYVRYRAPSAFESNHLLVSCAFMGDTQSRAASHPTGRITLIRDRECL